LRIATFCLLPLSDDGIDVRIRQGGGDPVPGKTTSIVHLVVPAAAIKILVGVKPAPKIAMAILRPLGRAIRVFVLAPSLAQR